MNGNAAAAVQSRTTLVDEIVAQAYRTALASTFESGLAILAVGGFGRRELFPHSDVDLLLLTGKNHLSDTQRSVVAGFLRNLWDSGLRLSHSVRTVTDCCTVQNGNIELSISLLDQRFVVGDHELYDDLSEKLAAFFRAEKHALIRHLLELTETRYAKFHGTIYHLEPNVKDTPGGLRDLQLVDWLARLRGAAGEEDPALQDARSFLSALRCKLHYSTGRDSNVLTFDAQEAMDDDAAMWMREYYRHARAVHRSAVREIEASERNEEGGLIQAFREWRGNLSNSDVTVARERVFLKSPQGLATDPDLAFRTFAFVARHGMRLSLETERRIREHRAYFEEYFASKPAVWPQLRAVLDQPHAAMAARAMHETGFLRALLPRWQDIELLVVRDFYHRYTVDEHTLVTLEYLEELRATADPARKRFAELLDETEQQPLLYLALLLHDIGKAAGANGHAEASATAARGLLARLQLSPEEQTAALFLIENHLHLSAVMNGRDLGDPATAAALAERVGTVENLKRLTLLTYADISAVNPEAMTPWRLEQLWRTYRVAHRELTRELQSGRIQPAEDDARAGFLGGLPARYLRTHNNAQITRHMELAARSSESGVGVELVRESGVWRADIVTQDRPRLLASLAGVLAGFGMNIVKAEAFANARGLTVDTFSFGDPMRTLELNPEETQRLKKLLTRAALGKENVRKLIEGRASFVRLKGPEVEAAVAFDNKASDTATLVEIIAADRPGLLFDLAWTFSEDGCSIDLVLIDTEARKAIDVLYVTAEGKKLPDERHAYLRDQLLHVAHGQEVTIPAAAGSLQ